jgi:hypothetical protein
MASAAEPTTTPAACCAPPAAPSLSEAQAQATARRFKALADLHRVRPSHRQPDPGTDTT